MCVISNYSVVFFCVSLQYLLLWAAPSNAELSLTLCGALLCFYVTFGIDAKR